MKWLSDDKLNHLRTIVGESGLQFDQVHVC